MELQKALSIAHQIIEKLSSYCSIINLAGSIRREKAEVKDIEIVCLPKTIRVPYGDIFDQKFIQIPEEKFKKLILSLGKIVKGKYDGKMMQIELGDRRITNGIMLDLFMPDDFDYYRQLAIRTGSADYSHKIIAVAWRKKGWCGSNQGLRKISDCIHKDTKWVCLNTHAERPPLWKSEEEFFEWIGVKWIHPSLRNI